MMKVFLVSLLITAVLAYANPMVVVLSGKPPAAYEGFEGTGAPTNWSDPSTGATPANWDYATTPIAGTQSLLLVSPAANQTNARYDFPEDADEIWVAFKMKFNPLPSSNFNDIFRFLNSSNATLALVRVATNGSITCAADSGFTSFWQSLAINTVYKIKVRYKKGTGTNEEIEIWCVTDGSGSWGSSRSSLTGTSTTRADKIMFQSPDVAINSNWYDNVLVSTADIAITNID